MGGSSYASDHDPAGVTASRSQAQQRREVTPLLNIGGTAVEVRRSRRRRRTVSARWEGRRIVVLAPAGMRAAEEEHLVTTLVARLKRRRIATSDEDLMTRAGQLSERYLCGLARPASVRWVGNQRSRWGSCTPAEGAIRVTDRLHGQPPWVIDYVLLHELAHLLEPGHGPAFWALVRRYERHERARGFLDGLEAGWASGIGDDGIGDEGSG